MGSKGVYWLDGARGGFAPAFPVVAVDTVAAGDAFNGGLATALDAGLPLEQAIRWGLAAGALSVDEIGRAAVDAYARRGAERMLGHERPMTRHSVTLFVSVMNSST